MEKYEDKYNAIVTSCHLKKEASGRLDGLTIAIKDNISTKGVKTTGSSKILDNYIPVFNATVVEKVLAEGATIVAKTSMDELGMGGFGTTAATGVVLNPFDKTRVAGGSSAGSAVLVADGFTDVSLGTDTGDSMRIPASYCGVVGLKPTYGRVSRYGVIPYASSLDHVGIFSKDVKGSAIMLEVISGYDAYDQTSSHKPVEDYGSLDNDLQNITIGVIDNVIDDISDQKIMKRFNELLNKLKEKNVDVNHVTFNHDVFDSLGTVYKIIANAEAFSNHSNLNGVPFGCRETGDSLDEIMGKTREKGLGYQVRQRHLLGAYSLTGTNYHDIFLKAQQVRRLMVDEINEKLENVDFFIAPASGRVAPKVSEININDSIRANNYMVMDNFSGHPGIVIPMGLVDGLPIGVYLSTHAFEEKKLLTLAALIEEVVGELV